MVNKQNNMKKSTKALPLYTKKEAKALLKAKEEFLHKANLLCEEYIMLDAENRALQKHFNLTDKQYADIVDRYIGETKVPFLN